MAEQWAGKHTPPPYTTHNIKDKFLKASTQYLLHKNAPHTAGTRYCIVLFNKNTSYAGCTDPRIEALKDQPIHESMFVQVCEGPEVDAAKAALLAVCEQTRFPADRCTSTGHTAKPHSKYGAGVGHFISFGETASRKSRVEREKEGLMDRASSSMNNTKYKGLYDAFCTYMDLVHPGLFGVRYRSCIIAKNAQCEWHKDLNNVGDAVLGAFGSFTGGGELLIMRCGCTPSHGRSGCSDGVA
jgi:hypothetical protein